MNNVAMVKLLSSQHMHTFPYEEEEGGQNTERAR